METWIITLEEVLPDFGINLDEESIKKLAKIMKDTASIESSMDFDRCGGRASETTIDYKKLYLSLIDDLSYEREEKENLKETNTYLRRSILNLKEKLEEEEKKGN